MSTAMARHILVKDIQTADAVKERLKKGEEFARLAKQFSTCGSKKNGGDLGEIRRGQLVKPVEKVIFTGALKTLHGPVKSKFGYHLIQVYFRD
ncbi:Peptidyl-prolyl cis-trans isomerase C [BD1-7 clade bacterium]|uniref:Peptidyl-prolyl cis-trans isomerase C n=1 Tax=BD1-7 clade bacterium TaxID=2029982 RepID=A0A5S9PMQ6_9GAMM|nr:Peptidyl-prolyl cis-trans isomerase C [BD1-7 clade bacterium]